ncbi:factor activating pos9, partial [Ascosphaera pollenicola]
QRPDYLSDLSAIIPGGRLRPSGLDPTIERRLAQLESDRSRLQAQVEEKQKAKRARLREWERLVHESAAGAVRSEYAEAHLQKLTEGDSVVGGIAF